MTPKPSVLEFFNKSKVMFATLAMAITFMITLYNQFKPVKATEISGIVASSGDLAVPVDAIVRISSPIQAQTETDSNGRFKFKFQNLQSDTFLLIIQNKTTNLVHKQTEYVNASEGRNDIIVLSRQELKEVSASPASSNRGTSKKRPTLKKRIRGLFH